MVSIQHVVDFPHLYDVCLCLQTGCKRSKYIVGSRSDTNTHTMLFSLLICSNHEMVKSQHRGMRHNVKVDISTQS